MADEPTMFMRILKIVHIFDGHIFGEAVVKYLLDEPIDEVDICMMNLSTDKFIKMLKIFYNVVRNDIEGYYLSYIINDDFILNIYPINSSITSIQSDFDINLLKIDKNKIEMLNSKFNLLIDKCYSPLIELIDKIKKKRFLIINIIYIDLLALINDEHVELTPKERAFKANVIMKTIKKLQNGWTCENKNLLPNITIVSEDDTIQCSICSHNEDKYYFITKCNHSFHCECIMKWARELRTEFRCPLCRELNPIIGF